MAYVVSRANGSWEVRESRSTGAGPRSRTLATFRTLTPTTVEVARARSTKPLAAEEVLRAAARAGAPVASAPADRAASDLLSELAAGRPPRPALRRILAAALAGDADQVSDSARAAGAWLSATPERRADALRDLLLLTDRLPSRPRDGRRFPRIDSAPA